MAEFVFRKQVSEPWLSWIIDGQKKYEGRLFLDDWAKLNDGDNLLFFNEEKSVLVKIKQLIRYPTFGAAWNDLGQELLPVGASSTEEADKLYHDIYIKKYGSNYEKVLNENGVIILNLIVINDNLN